MITKKQLKELSKDATPLEKAVIREAIDHDNPEGFFKDLLYHGCQSGMIDGLIYYKDTEKFADKHWDEIEELKNEMEDSLGEPLKMETPIKNWLAWFGFEETARKIVEKLGIEV